MKPTPSLAELVDALFKTHLREDGREYSTYEVAKRIEELGCGRVNASHIAKLRRGESANPSRDILLRLCMFFRVPASYFFPELDQLSLYQGKAEEDPAIQARVAFRAAGLTPDEQAHLEGIFAALRRRRNEP
jgi:transcriptional regulator with XRE-family HTH domain